MDKIVITTHNGVSQDSHLLAIGYGDDFDERHNLPAVYICDTRKDNFQYVSIQDIAAYWHWYDNLTNVAIETLCKIAADCVRYNLIKGWAALVLLTEDPGYLSDNELLSAIEAAEQHTGFMRYNALDVLQYELDNRELGEEE
jgi:hypothetical protein